MSVFDMKTPLLLFEPILQFNCFASFLTCFSLVIPFCPYGSLSLFVVVVESVVAGVN